MIGISRATPHHMSLVLPPQTSAAPFFFSSLFQASTVVSAIVPAGAEGRSSSLQWVQHGHSAVVHPWFHPRRRSRHGLGETCNAASGQYFTGRR
jgi:hypothetical protein